jgi:hypothetical protein
MFTPFALKIFIYGVYSTKYAIKNVYGCMQCDVRVGPLVISFATVGSWLQKSENQDMKYNECIWKIYLSVPYSK